MSITKRPDGTLFVEEYTYMEYCQSIQTCIQAGFEFSFENRDFPTHYSAPFTAGFKPIVMKDRKQVETSTETPLKDDSSPVTDTVGTVVAETSKDAVEAPKQATVKRTTPKK